MVDRWYVVQTKSKHEDTAQENLINQNFTVFFPRVMEHKKVRGKSISELTALFPNYLFVQFDITKAKWRAISGTRGVVKLLGSTDKYASPLPKGFAEELQKRADKDGTIPVIRVEKALIKYLPGERVKIKEGLFRGLTGTCKVSKNNLVSILLTLLSGKVEVRLPIQSIEYA